MPITLQVLLLTATALYQAIACWLEDRHSPAGQLIDVGGYRLHLWVSGKAPLNCPTIVLDHSLGGVEGYLLMQELAKLTRVCIYDRAGYGWSDHSPHARSSQHIVAELDTMLTRASIEPPYLLIGNSLGSYNVRLYAARYPGKVVGMVLTEGFHEAALLKMPRVVRALQLFFLSGFLMSVLGSSLGIVRLLKLAGVFEWLKPELRQFSPAALRAVKRSFCRPKHWITMSREIWNLDVSGRELRQADQFESLPIATIKAGAFFHSSAWTLGLPLQAANRLRDEIHKQLLKLSTNCTPFSALRSGHFVWVDQPAAILEATKTILEKV
ncbi:alpha/beta hydrolase [Phormidium tenue FACHB-886]|nr:alpha/beta hydrolase [Phormidium tenue FACHB-886]